MVETRAEKWRELLKAFVLLLLALAIASVADVPFLPTVTVSLAHVSALAGLGYCLLRVCKIRPPASRIDDFAVCYVAGWPCLTVPILLASVTRNIGAAVACTALVAAAVAYYSRRSYIGAGDEAAPRSGPVPFAVYVLALLYAVACVALPFHFFSSNSLFREMYGDVVQRFGTTYALAQGIPPSNPFFAGAPLSYYWFALFPLAAELRLIHGNLFDIWKCANLWTALLFPIGLWILIRDLFGRRVVAWSVLLFGFFFSSYEVFSDTNFIGALRKLLIDWRWADFRAQIVSKDPDMLTGIVTAYSDQLLLEDFLYIPQNTAALMVVLVGLRLLHAGRSFAAAFCLSALAGVNTFYAIPVFVAFGFVSWRRSGLRTAVLDSLLLASWALTWLTICRIVASPRFEVAAGLALGVTLLAVWLSRRIESPATTALSGDRWLKAAAILFLVSVLAICLLRPSTNAAVFLMNYGPAFVLGMVLTFHLAVRGGRRLPTETGHLLFFLLLACATYFTVSFFLYLQFVPLMPDGIRTTARAAGLELNLFNFYHKVGKLVRLSWAVFAGVMLALYAVRLRTWLAFAPLRWTIGLLLCLAALTGFLRPLTYASEAPVAEFAASQWLQQQPEFEREVILLEDFRTSAINELLPVTVFYYSTWSGGNPALTHTVGTWAEQYLPRRWRPRASVREAQNQKFFAPETSADWRHRFLAKNRIGFILSRHKFDFQELADLVVDQPSGYLYRVAEQLPP